MFTLKCRPEVESSTRKDITLITIPTLVFKEMTGSLQEPPEAGTEFPGCCTREPRVQGLFPPNLGQAFRVALPTVIIHSPLKSSFWMDHGIPPMPLETATSPSAYSPQPERLSKNSFTSKNTGKALIQAILPSFSTAPLILLVMLLWSHSASQAGSDYSTRISELGESYRENAFLCWGRKPWCHPLVMFCTSQEIISGLNN